MLTSLLRRIQLMRAEHEMARARKVEEGGSEGESFDESDAARRLAGGYVRRQFPKKREGGRMRDMEELGECSCLS